MDYTQNFTPAHTLDALASSIIVRVHEQGPADPFGILGVQGHVTPGARGVLGGVRCTCDHKAIFSIRNPVLRQQYAVELLVCSLQLPHTANFSFHSTLALV